MKVLSRPLVVTMLTLALWGFFRLLGWTDQMRDFSITMNHSLAADFFSRNSFLSSDLAIVPLDEKFYQWYGREPLRRSHMALLMKRILQAGARSVYLDIFLEKPSSYDDDKPLLDLLEQQRGRVFFPSVILQAGKKASGAPPLLAKPAEIFSLAQTGYVNLPVSLRHPFVTGFSVMADPGPGQPLPLAMAMLGTSMEIQKGKGSGFSFIWPGTGENCRYQTGQIIPMAFQIPPDDSIHLRDLLCRTRPEELLGPANPFEANRSESIAASLETNGEKSFNRDFQNKIVLIGDTTWKGKDWFRTPAGMMSGIEVLATSLNTLMANAPIKFLFRDTELFQVGLAALAMAFITLHGSGRLSILMIVMALIILPLAQGYTLAHKQIHLCLHAALFGLLASWITASAWLNLRWSRMGIYIASRLRDKILMEDLEKGLTRKKVAILFSDIRGFTNLSEHLPTDLVIKLLEEYFDGMAAIITAPNKGGTLDKFMGDGILAFFGDPIPMENPTANAMTAAKCMVETFASLKESWLSNPAYADHIDRLSRIGIGIGISTGQVYVGNIGARKVGFMDYTCIGREVNLASRLEGMAGPGQVLVCPKSAAICPDMCRSFTQAQIKGFDHKVEVFTISHQQGEK